MAPKTTYISILLSNLFWYINAMQSVYVFLWNLIIYIKYFVLMYAAEETNGTASSFKVLQSMLPDINAYYH